MVYQDIFKILVLESKVALYDFKGVAAGAFLTLPLALNSEL